MTDKLLDRVRTVFEASFHEKPALAVQAPARVNIIGEHTDYNDGFVFPCAIDYQTVVCISPRADEMVCVIAADYSEERDEFKLSRSIPHHGSQQWSDYVRGVVLYLYQKVTFRGANICIGGNVPQGAGLSSSASLEVSVATAFNELYQLMLTPTDIALLSQAAENHFVGCNCGIMDQLISARGEKNHALLIDCRSLEAKPVTLPEGILVMIVNSHVKRGLVDSEYNARRQQCEAAARFFNVRALRDVSMDMLQSAKGLDPLLLKRARHIVSENQRTLEMVEAMNTRNIRQISRLMAESHISMKNDFEITHPAIDYLVDIIQEVVGDQGGVRMTGGGFGGCVVALVPESLVSLVRETVEDRYQKKTGLPETIYLCHPQQGAGKLLF